MYPRFPWDPVYMALPNRQHDVFPFTLPCTHCAVIWGHGTEGQRSVGVGVGVP